jgi:hypothetical protein
MQPLDARFFFFPLKTDILLIYPDTTKQATSTLIFAFSILNALLYHILLLLRRHREHIWILVSLRHQCTDSSDSFVIPFLEAHTLCAPHTQESCLPNPFVEAQQLLRAKAPAKPHQPLLPNQPHPRPNRPQPQAQPMRPPHEHPFSACRLSKSAHRLVVSDRARGHPPRRRREMESRASQR